MLQENLVDFNPFRGILSVSRERDRSNIPVERTVCMDFKIILHSCCPQGREMPFETFFQVG